jgi:hypothetical protein
MADRNKLAKALRQLAAIAADAERLDITLTIGGTTLRVQLGAAEVLAAPPATAPTHSSDYRVIDWPGLGRFVLSALQGKVVERLWAAMEKGEPSVPQAELLRVAGSDGVRLADLFKRSSAWGVLVVSVGTGQYSLPPLTPPAD